MAAWPAKMLSLVMAVLFDMTHCRALRRGFPTACRGRRTVGGVGILCGVCVGRVGILRYARRAAGAALAACAVFVALVASIPLRRVCRAGTLELTALDCGQGDCVFRAPEWDHDIAGCGRQPLAGSAGGRLSGPALGFGRGHCFTLSVVAWRQEDRCGGVHSCARGRNQRALLDLGKLPRGRVLACSPSRISRVLGAIGCCGETRDSDSDPHGRRLPSIRRYLDSGAVAGAPTRLSKVPRQETTRW